MRASCLWGVDLGTGFSTIRVTSLYWLSAVGVFLIGSPVAGAAMLSAYGLGLATSLSLGVFFLRGTPGSCSANVRVLTVQPRITRVLGALLFVFAAALAISAVR